MKSALALGSLLVMASAHGQYLTPRMPAYSLTTLDGKKLSNKSLKGKVVLLDFWATWCGPCKASSPAMEKLYNKYKSKGVVVIGADVFEQTPGPVGARNYKKEHGYNYIFTYNSDDLAKKLGVGNIPAFAMIDKDGILRATQMGLPRGGPDALVAYFSKKIDAALK